MKIPKNIWIDVFVDITEEYFEFELDIPHETLDAEGFRVGGVTEFDEALTKELFDMDTAVKEVQLTHVSFVRFEYNVADTKGIDDFLKNRIAAINAIFAAHRKRLGTRHKKR